MPGKSITVFEAPQHRVKRDRAALSLTLEMLFEKYTGEGRHLPDGSLKTERYLDHVRQTGRYLAKFFGRGQLVSELTPDLVHDYVVWRRGGRAAGRRVGANTIRRDLGMFKAALNWACQKYEGGHPLLSRHALEKVRIPTEKDPKRPVLDMESIRALVTVAPIVHPFLRPMILLAWRTGRRLSSILAPRRDDVDFEKGTIRWRPEHDKIRQTWVVPARRDLLKELRRFRAERPGIGSVLLLPHPQRGRHYRGPVTRHLAAYWLKEAFDRGKIAKPKGGLWHMFRRAWATERKDLPLKDVAAAGGWRDTSTLLRYQQPDEATLRAVVEFERSRGTAWFEPKGSPWWALGVSGGLMTKAVHAITLLLVAAGPARAQDWHEQLKANLVTISSGKMTLSDVGLYKIQVPGYQAAQFQVKIHSEAPAAGSISRDNFVSLTTLMASTVFINALAEGYRVPASEFMQHIDFTELKSAIGTPDLELNVIMTTEGMQLEVVNNSSGQRTRQTMTWEQVFTK